VIVRRLYIQATSPEKSRHCNRAYSTKTLVVRFSCVWVLVRTHAFSSAPLFHGHLVSSVHTSRMAPYGALPDAYLMQFA